MPTVRKTTQPRAGKGVILDAAIVNFHQRGFHATSMRDIARDAEITVASIYHHFASKQEILQDIMVRTLSDVISETRTALLGCSPDPAEQLSALMKAWVLFHTLRQPEALVGASEIRSLDRQGRRMVVTLRDEQERMFKDVVRRGTESGAFATRYPMEASRAIINMGYSVASWYNATGDLDPVAMAEQYAELALSTVQATASQPETA